MSLRVCRACVRVTVETRRVICCPASRIVPTLRRSHDRTGPDRRHDFAAAGERRRLHRPARRARLGFRYVDREILKEAAALLGLEDESRAEPLDEQATGLWRRIARAVAVGPPDAPFVPPPPPTFDAGDLLDAQVRIIQEIAARESAVIVGRGAPHVLHGRDHIVRVFVHAPKDRRIAEVERTYRIDAAAAREMVERSDRDRARFVQSLTKRVWTDACLYDLTIDTSVIAPDLAIDLLVSAVRALQAPHAPPSAASSPTPAAP